MAAAATGDVPCAPAAQNIPTALPFEGMSFVEVLSGPNVYNEMLPAKERSPAVRAGIRALATPTPDAPLTAIERADLLAEHARYVAATTAASAEHSYPTLLRGLLLAATPLLPPLALLAAEYVGLPVTLFHETVCALRPHLDLVHAASRTYGVTASNYPSEQWEVHTRYVASSLHRCFALSHVTSLRPQLRVVFAARPLPLPDRQRRALARRTDACAAAPAAVLADTRSGRVRARRRRRPRLRQRTRSAEHVRWAKAPATAGAQATRRLERRGVGTDRQPAVRAAVPRRVACHAR